MKLTETFTAKINEIKADVKGTLHTLKELEHDRSPKNSWTDDYMKVVMENQMWLIEKVESIRAKNVANLVKEIKDLEFTLDKLDVDYQKDITSAEGAKRSYRNQRDSLRVENARLIDTIQKATKFIDENTGTIKNPKGLNPKEVYEIYEMLRNSLGVTE